MGDSVPLSQSATPPSAFVAAGEISSLKLSEKAYTILGTEAMPPKLQQRLGSLDGSALIKARQAEKREREKELERVVNQRPSAEQLKIPVNAEVPLAEKALDVLGSEELKEMSRIAVPNKTKIKNYAKLVALLGELDVTSDKAQQLLGSIEQTAAAVRKADLELQRETVQRKEHQMKKVLSAPVTAQQLELPAAARARAIHEPVVSLKALELMGEEALNKAAREHVPDGLHVQPKVSGESYWLAVPVHFVSGNDCSWRGQGVACQSEDGSGRSTE